MASPSRGVAFEQGVEADGPFEIPPGSILDCKDPDGIALSIFWDR